MANVGILVSGGGTNLQNIIDGIETGSISNANITAVIASKAGVYALERAAKSGIDSTVISRKLFDNTEEYDKAMIEFFDKHNVDIVVMAGFLSMVGKNFVNKYSNRIINIHPALIPAFCGKGMYGIKPHVKVLEYGVKITGATVHFVDCEYDSGPIIFQKAVAVKQDDTAELLQQRVMEEAEKDILPKAVDLLANDKLKVEGRIVKILD